MNRSKSELRIVIYGQDFLPTVGGVQTIMNLLATGLVEMNSRLSSNECFLRTVVTVVTRTAANGMDDSVLPYAVIRRPSLALLLKLIRDTDVVHVAGPCLLPLAISWLMRKPVVVEHHGFQAVCPNGQFFHAPSQTLCPGYFSAGRYAECLRCTRSGAPLTKAVQMLLLTPVRRWLTNTAAANITPTDWLASILRIKRMTTVLHGVSRPTLALGDELSASSFAYLGRLVSTKGIGVLIQAARQLHLEGLNFRLKVIGEGPEEHALKTLAAGIDGKIEFLGYVANDQLDRALSDVGTVVMPSLAGEVFGLAAAENMLRGKLLIVSDIGALHEVVGNVGLIFPPGDAGALASCMRKVLNDPGLVKSLGAEARTRALRVFNPEVMVNGHASLYQRLRSQQRPQRDWEPSSANAGRCR